MPPLPPRVRPAFVAAPQPVVHKSAVLSPQQLKKLVAPLARKYPGALVVGVASPEGQTVTGFGKDLQGHPVNGETVFETASLSKVFSALLLAQAVNRGDLQLDEPVNDAVCWRVPVYGEKQITICQLAQHTSGLPDWPDNRGDTTSPYSSRDLQRYLEHGALAFPPGEDIIYSNTGFALLGEILAQQAHTSYERLLTQNICTPLEMKDTRVHPTAAMRSRMAIGHSANGRQMASSAPTAGGGADGIRSTANDLLKFISAYAGLSHPVFEKAICDSYSVRDKVDEANDIGLGWYTRRADGIVWKGGCIAGYRTYLGFIPDKHLGVVVLAGCNAFPSPDLGNALLLEMDRALASPIASHD
jgi:CubicO group peptidase (beta-lactamase class C family)